jgi:hypothetical protein
MSFLDTLKSGAEGLVGAAAQKLGVDPAQAEAMLAKVMPGETAPADAAAPAADGTPAAAPAAQADTSILGKVNALLDRDGDGNALNDVTGMIGNIFAKK